MHLCLPLRGQRCDVEFKTSIMYKPAIYNKLYIRLFWIFDALQRNLELCPIYYGHKVTLYYMGLITQTVETLLIFSIKTAIKLITPVTVHLVRVCFTFKGIDTRAHSALWLSVVASATVGQRVSVSIPGSGKVLLGFFRFLLSSSTDILIFIS
ncbi:hypothetical protein SFRURICE_020029, partial [Spodoptera frugiperda]